MDYDARYLGGVRFFNEGDFFEAHEVWEDLWLNTAGPERRFYQGLIQAAVALYHFGNGNLRAQSSCTTPVWVISTNSARNTRGWISSRSGRKWNAALRRRWRPPKSKCL